MPSCNTLGCSCNTCQNCGEYYDTCKCDLIKRSKELLNTKSAEDNDYSKYHDLLQEWLNNTE